MDLPIFVAPLIILLIIWYLTFSATREISFNYVDVDFVSSYRNMVVPPERTTLA